MALLFRSPHLRCRTFPKTALSIVAAILAWTCPLAAGAQQLFRTPDEAASALADAADSGNLKRLFKVLGAGGADIISSGDPVADDKMRKLFVDAYGAGHRIALEKDNKAILIVGPEDFPFPIPLVRKYGEWKFDTAAGRYEILYRRIGRNELSAMQAGLAFVDAQNEYAEKHRTRFGVGGYAQRIVSQPGQKDGLYWPDPNEESPLGEFAAAAAAEGYRVGSGRAPFHGYYFRILTRQGEAAPGGALNYVVKGDMIGGFALVAYPAEYRNSGVMTFLVNHTGDIFQKDLGPRTEATASRMTSFNPDHTWKKVSVENAAIKP